MSCSRSSLFSIIVLSVFLSPISREAGPRGTASHGTAEVILIAPGAVVVAADSKEVSYSYLSDGTTLSSSSEACKLRRVGDSFVFAAGFIRASGFNALDYIRDLHQNGEALHGLALRVKEELPLRLGPALESARNVGDQQLRTALAEADALEVALLGVENGAPAVELIVFRAVADTAGRMRIKTLQQRCPGDCPNGRAAWFLGQHEAIDETLAAEPRLTQHTTQDVATRLLALEYIRRPEIVGGPRSVLEADGTGVRVVEAGACSADELGQPEALSRALTADAVKPFLDELDLRMSRVTNLVCHQTIQRHSKAGRQIRRDVVDAELQIVGNRELYSEIRSNGRTYPDFTSLPGAWASGDLLTMLRVTRDGISSGEARMESRQGKDGMPETGVTFRKPEGSGLWKLFVESAPHPLGFEGTAWYAADGGLRTIEWRSTGQVRPARLNIAEISWEVSFSAVDVAGESLLAPAAASYAVKYRPEVRREDRTQATFTGFRRFAGMARMLE